MKQSIFKRIKQYISVLLIVVLLVQIGQGKIVLADSDSNADGNSKYGVSVYLHAGDSAITQSVKEFLTVTMGETELKAWDIKDNKFNSTISVNAVPGQYRVKVSSSNYDFDKNVLFSLSNNTLSADVDLSESRLYTVRGTVTENVSGNNAQLMKDVTVSAYPKGSSESAGSGKTDENGNYAVKALKPGKYTFVFKHMNAKEETREVIVKNSDPQDEVNVVMKLRQKVTINITNPDGGVVTVLKNGEPEFKSNDTTNSKDLDFHYGDTLNISAQANPGCNIQECSQYYPNQDGVIFGPVSINSIDADYTMDIKFSYNTTLEIRKYNSEMIMDPSNGIHKASVSLNSPETGMFTINVVKDDEHRYPVIIQGDNYVTKEKYGVYRFNSNGAVTISLDKDNNPPTIDIDTTYSSPETEIINDTIYGRREVTFKLNIDDTESGVNQVGYFVKDKYRKVDSSHILSISKYDFEGDTDRSITVSANDYAGNCSTKKIYFSFNEEPPVIRSVSINSATPTFYQNGQAYVFRNIKLDAHITDDSEFLKNVRYYVSDHALEIEELKTKSFILLTSIAEPKYTHDEGSEMYSFDVNVDRLQQGINYVYVTAEDINSNVQWDMDSIGLIKIGYDTDPPGFNLNTKPGDEEDTWKKPGDTVTLMGSGTENWTSDGLFYAIDVYQNEITVPNEPEQSVSWNSIKNVNQDGSYSFEESVELSAEGTNTIAVWVKDGSNNISKPFKMKYHVDGHAPIIKDLTFDVREDNKSIVHEFFLSIANFFRGEKAAYRPQTVYVNATIFDEPDGTGYSENPMVKDVRLYYFTSEETDKAEAFKDSIATKDTVPDFGEYSKLTRVEGDKYSCKLQVPKEEKLYRMYVIAVDKAGNVACATPVDSGKYKSQDIMVDSASPLLSFDILDQYETPDYLEATKSGTRRWYKAGTNVTYNLDTQDMGSGLYSVDVTVNDKKINKKLADDNKVVAKYSQEIDLSGCKVADDGHVTYTVEVADNAGNPSSISKKIYLDEDKPVITQIIFEGADEPDDLKIKYHNYGFYFKKNTIVRVYATDNIVEKTDKNDKKTYIGSGVKEFIYYTESFDGTKSEEKTLKAVVSKGVYTASFEIKGGFKGQIYVRAVDNVGQKTAFQHPKGTVIESYKEHINSASSTTIELPPTSYRDEEDNYLYSTRPTITYNTSDIKSGIAGIDWNLQAQEENVAEDKGNVIANANYNAQKQVFETKLLGNTDGWKVKDKLELNLVKKLQRQYAVVSEKNHITASFSMTDNVGHSAPKTEKTFSVDLTAPKIKVEYNNNEVYHEKYYNKDRVATITVTDANFKSEDCTYDITGPEVEKSPWEHHAKGGCNGRAHSKECEWTSTVTFSRDGDYTFGFKCTDRAGWSASYDKVDEFTIDKTNPEISVTYDNNNVKNERYYKEKRTATVHIEEHNFDPKDVEIKMTASDSGRSITVPQVHGWSKSNDTNTATIEYDYDGEFTFDIDYIDLANNEANDYAMDSFIVDLTEPELEISGVEDMSANNGTVVPIISCKDSNIDTAAIEITLTGANNGSTKYDSKREFTRTTADYTIADLAHVKKMDDLYTLTAKAVDKAGNEYEESIHYSVNRFGSVYVLSDDTQALVDNVYTNAEKDIKVSEINVDKLMDRTVTYSKESDIVTLQEGDDYTVNEKGDEGSWKVYEYSIKSKNFESEGKYTVTLLSKDRATNTSDNKAKGKDIEFVVDKTPPTIVLSGIENRAQYTDDTRVLTINTEDNIGMRSLSVECDGKELAKFDQSQILEGNGTLTVTLKSSNDWQEVNVVALDVAGNQKVSDSIRFLLTRNLFVQWYRNTFAFIGTLALLALLAALVIFLISRKQKKDKIEVKA